MQLNYKLTVNENIPFLYFSFTDDFSSSKMFWNITKSNDYIPILLYMKTFDVVNRNSTSNTKFTSLQERCVWYMHYHSLSYNLKKKAVEKSFTIHIINCLKIKVTTWSQFRNKCVLQKTVKLPIVICTDLYWSNQRSYENTNPMVLYTACIQLLTLLTRFHLPIKFLSWNVGTGHLIVFCFVYSPISLLWNKTTLCNLFGLKIFKCKKFIIFASNTQYCIIFGNTKKNL